MFIYILGLFIYVSNIYLPKISVCLQILVCLFTFSMFIYIFSLFIYISNVYIQKFLKNTYLYLPLLTFLLLFFFILFFSTVFLILYTYLYLPLLTFLLPLFFATILLNLHTDFVFIILNISFVFHNIKKHFG